MSPPDIPSDTSKDRVAGLRDDLLKHAPLDASRLRDFVAQCEAQGLFQAFLDADDLALTLQAGHRKNAWLAIFCGAVATAVGILQLRDALNFLGWFAWAVEAVFFSLSAFFVARGLLRSRRENWLIKRYQAERFRLLPFRLVIDPEIWSGMKPRSNNWASLFAPEIDGIAALGKEDVSSLAGTEDLPVVPLPQQCQGIGEEALRTLGRFYASTILTNQKNYFAHKVEGAETGLSTNSRLGLLAFVLAGIFVLLHLFLELPWLGKLSKAAHGTSAAALVLSAIVVVTWAAYRTWLSANEFSRNAIRARAKRDALIQYSKEIDEVLKVTRETGSSIDSWRVFKTLSLCQAMLEAEKREWLRLMAEAEWY